MTVRDLIVRLSQYPQECRVLLDVDGIVGDLEEVDVVEPLSDYVCAGFNDNLENIGVLLGKKVVILQ